MLRQIEIDSPPASSRSGQSERRAFQQADVTPGGFSDRTGSGRKRVVTDPGPISIRRAVARALRVKVLSSS